MEKIGYSLISQKFLRNGRFENISEKELAAECEKIIQDKARQSLKSARKIAEKYALQAEKHGKLLRLSSNRTLARITHLSGDHPAALKAYLKARELTGKDKITRARIDRALVDVYMYLGRNPDAVRAAGRAMRTFKNLQADVDLAQTRVNYANLLHRQDRHREAEKLYREAAEYFEKTDNRPAVARCYYNRANTLVQLFELEKAEKLYNEARTIYLDNEFTLDACDADYGIAWLRMLKGDFHTALMDLSGCEKTYREGGDPRGEALCKLDRAEIFLALGLYNDAIETARLAEHKFTKLGLRYETAKAALFRGQAAILMRRKKEAQVSMARAKEGFEAERNKGFLGAVHLLAADMADTDQNKRNKEISAARRQFNYAQLPLWEAVCDLYRAVDRDSSGPALKRLEQNAAVKEVPHLYTLWQTFYGDYEFHLGRLREARRRWHLAADRLDAVRAQLPPLELRNAFSRKLTSPHMRLIASEISENIKMAAVWSERYKTAGIWAPVASIAPRDDKRKKIEESLAALARQVAGMARNISAQSGLRSFYGTPYGSAFTKLQNKVRERLFEIEDMRGGKTAGLNLIARSFRDSSYNLPIIQFHLQNDDIYAFIHQKGEIRSHCFKGGSKRVNYAMQQWRFILENEILHEYLGGNGNFKIEQSFWKELGEWLWPPLEIDSDSGQVLILPEGELTNLPWPALILNDRPLMDRHSFVIAPSLRHYMHARKNIIDSKKVFVFKGKSDNLPEIGKEMKMLTRLAGKNAAIFNPCRRKDWPESGDARLWHYTGHAQMRTDNPFYSYLILHDGPIFAADFRLRQCRVGLVTLSACRSGEQITLPGEELTGLARSLLEMGARNVLASHWPVSDSMTTIWMKAFYNKYFKGVQIQEAARLASKTVREEFPSAYYWAAFSIFGAGDMGENYENQIYDIR